MSNTYSIKNKTPEMGRNIYIYGHDTYNYVVKLTRRATINGDPTLIFSNDSGREFTDKDFNHWMYRDEMRL